MRKEIPMLEGTTILAVRRQGQIALAGDGQVTHGETVLKRRASKIRRLAEGAVLAGFAGSTADAFTLFEKFEVKLKEFGGNLTRSAVELAKDWRMDRALRRLEAMLLVADRSQILLLSGSGDVLQPDDDAIGIGSGGSYALSAARALLEHTDLPARQIAEAAMRIAGEVCVYTNTELTIEEL